MYKKRDEEDIGLLQHDHNDQDKCSIAVLNIEQEDEARNSPQPITIKRDGMKRYCRKCKLEKLDRTHHCRQCKRCVLKMDQYVVKIDVYIYIYIY